MGNWLKMVKELTLRPKGERKIREAPSYPFDGDMSKPFYLE